MYIAVQDALIAPIDTSACEPHPQSWKIGEQVQFTIMGDTHGSPSLIAVYAWTAPLCTIEQTARASDVREDEYWTTIKGKVIDIEPADKESELKEFMRKQTSPPNPSAQSSSDG